MRESHVVRALLAAGMLAAASTGAHATTVDLSTALGLSGTIDTVIFENPANRLNVGTGVVNPFLTIQHNDREKGFNTNAAAEPYDTKRSGGGYVRGIQVNEIGIVDLDPGAGQDLYRQFFLDINEENGLGKEFLSLDNLKIALRSGVQSGGDGKLDTAGFEALAQADFIYGMDFAADSEVLLNYDLGQGSGLSADMTFYVPNALFGNDGLAWVYLYAEFGGKGKEGSGQSTKEWGSGDGFEEFWALKANGIKPPVECPPGSTDPDCVKPPVDIPEPGSLLLAGAALLGLAAVRRRRSKG